MLQSIKLLGVRIHSLSASELNEQIGDLIKGRGKHIIANVNINAMNIAFEHKWFLNFLNEATINFCDGDGVRLGAKIQGKKIKEKITYNRWIWEFARFCEEKGFSFYFIGSEQETIEKAVKMLNSRFPSLDIRGWRNGFFKNEKEIEKCVEEINHLSPNVILLGMGMPYQEKWLFENSKKLNFNIALTGGAVFEYISGNASMTPAIFFKLKLEWFYRFLMDPKRLFKRYFIGNPLFILRVLFHC